MKRYKIYLKYFYIAKQTYFRDFILEKSKSFKSSRFHGVETNSRTGKATADETV